MSALPFAFAPSIAGVEFQRIQRCMALDFFKWDSQVGDTSTLFPQPLMMSAETWQELKEKAESLASELSEAEAELLHRPELIRLLGLPKPLQAEFECQRYLGAPSPCVRVLRFDFHYTTAGWQISEVNSDVPGGYTEASRFTEMMQRCFPNAQTAGDPVDEWLQHMIAGLRQHAQVALLSAPGFLEDQQVTAFLANELRVHGILPLLLHSPSQLKWKRQSPFTVWNGAEIAVDAIIRFYQAEWLSRFPGRSEWKQLLFEGTAFVVNPGIAVLSESKRFPLIWDNLATGMSTWRSVMQECRYPSDECWRKGDEWVLKAAYSNTGDEVHIREFSTTNIWRQVCDSVKKRPTNWVVQRRFEAIPVASDVGLLYACVGVYTINGRACGIYGRASTQPITNYTAYDIAVLIDEAADAEKG